MDKGCAQVARKGRADEPPAAAEHGMDKGCAALVAGPAYNAARKAAGGSAP